MADKSVGELIAAQSVTPTDLFVLEQNGTAKKLTGQILEKWLVSFADGHGGIQSIAKLSTSGLADTYRITLADTTTFDFVVTNGRSINSIAKTSTSGLVDTYTITYNNGTTSKFTVTNGAKGDKGDNAYVWIKYASQKPTESSHSMGDIPDDWIGIYSGNASMAPTDWKQYQWFKHKGEKGDTGSPATLASKSVTYQVSDSGTIIPSGAWGNSIPVVSQGKYLWTKTELRFNTGAPVISYSVARMGMDGTGSVSTVAGVSPDATGNVALTAADVDALAVSGGAMTGAINMNGQPISGLNDPTEDTQAARKGYVDTKAALPKTASGTVIALSDASSGSLQGMRIYGKTTQDGTPTPDNPVELVSVGSSGSIEVSIGTSQEDTSPQTLHISTPNGLPGIPVTSGGNYTDANGQQWICDEVDFARGVYVQRVVDITAIGSDENNYSELNGFFRFKYTGLIDGGSGLCNICKVYQSYSSDGIYYNSGFIYFMFDSFGVSGTNMTVAKMKAWLSEHPMHLKAILATSMETALDAENLAAYAAIHTNKPNTTIYNDAGAHMDVGYYPPDATMRQEDIKKYVDSKHFLATVSIPAESWVGDAAPYTQTVPVSGILATDLPHVTPVYSSTLATALAQKEAWSMVNQGVPGAGEITFTCYEDKPTTAISIQIEVMR